MNILRIAGGATLAALLCAGTARADLPADGQPYSGWGIFGGGKNFIAFDLGGALADTAAGSVVGPDGSLYVAGTVQDSGTTRIGVAKFNAEGHVDLTFHFDGRNHSLETDVIATGVALTPSGHLLVSGIKKVSNTDYDMIVCRFHSDSGANINFPAPVNDSCVRPQWLPGTWDQSVGVVVHPDGKFVVGGTIDMANDGYAAFAQFLANGQPDTSYGNIQGSNVALVRSQNIFERHTLRAITRTSNGKVVGVGTTRIVGSNSDTGLMIRMLADGTPENLFSQVEFTFGLDDIPETAVDLMSVVTAKNPAAADDDIYVSGYATIGGTPQGLVAKIIHQGWSLATADFGIHPGFTLFPLDTGLRFQSIAYQPGVGLLLGSTRPHNNNLDMAVQRVNLYGLPDPLFGNGGGYFVDFSLPGKIDILAQVSVHGDGIYVVGHSLNANSDYNFTVAKHGLDRIFADGVEGFD
ncbi:hypothetical protein [Pseudofulvimonas gallinarii]|jgi:uncharacterized delta-60 repeat protein|uniref:Putative delta-60 repeat protein n=2 Tax=Pseudofulvimonas gallinarii TaxID=634155 RepID=A0A4R3LJZ4_9GAMM|nr:hypothetical protein [Pseudofulvimonas gallinarii]TCS98854.1 putative delta-60 repeat protein [Pseudofulvimonas gallinarii]